MKGTDDIFIFDPSELRPGESFREYFARVPWKVVKITNIGKIPMKRSTKIVVGKDNLPTFIHLAIDGHMTYVTVASTATGTQEFSMPTQIFEAMRVQFDELTEAIQRGA